ncbi:protein of unknown function [Taphrina deformans PYCC 5710]|uniref:Nucleolar complex-associated protein 3 n=1 Tax=Taphrina deformans (strain PYCC 5710 / ATCC 11124 / CBS 356.35 / IMI 108563 / JCM 9778 / NBRC 8474) TaxID=1097556 RepID=R4XJ41_TAPDE|nr:protein of unknown function [Taphrina deformans PYCC 5710]|eukprot:CCG84499.1 protein of unknown function [Taphrina deformans PYCC 5710]
MPPVSSSTGRRKVSSTAQQHKAIPSGTAKGSKKTYSSKAQASKPNKKGSKRKFVEIVHNEEREVSEDELKDFDGYEHFGDFLQELDPQALALKIQKQERNPFDVHRTETLQARNRLVNVQRRTSKSLQAQELSQSLGNSSDTASEVSDVIRRPSRQEQHESVEYEYNPRAFSYDSATEGSGLLPIKLSNGQVKAVIGKTGPVEQETPSAGKFSDSAVEVYDRKEVIPNMTSELAPGDQLLKTQEHLAKVALEIIEDPEENIGQISQIRDVQQTGGVIEQRFAIMTLSTVFRDIIPGYRIRPLTDLEKAEKVSKEVRRLRNFEQVLIEQYKLFVMSLLQLSKTSRKVTTPDIYTISIKTTAITAACSLLESVPHFNFRTELFSILANQVARKTTDVLFVRCRETIEALFRNDSEGEASFEGMRILCKKIKDRDYHIDQSTIGTFLHLRLLNEMEARGSTAQIDREKLKKKDRLFRTKKLKKFIKDQKDVEKDMEEAQATINSEVRERLQGDTLKLVFTTYFRILKERNSSIVGAALEGLARFANLINVDFFGDLLEVLKELMSNESSETIDMNTRDVLLCIVTAFTLLSGQAATKETISLDLSMFLSKLYQILLPLSLDTDVETSEQTRAIPTDLLSLKSRVNVATETEMVLRTLDAVFFKHRTQGVNKLAPFVKRLLTIALHLPEKSSIAILELNKRLLARYGKLHALWSTDESAGDGMYDGYTDNYELSNPATTSIWETSILRKHFSPKVKQAGNAMLETLLDAVNASR